MTYDVPCIFMICLRNSALGNCLALQRQSSVILESGLHKKENQNPLMIHLLLHALIHLLYLSQQALCPEGCQTQQRNIRKYSVIATHRNRSLASKSGPRGHRRMKKHVMTGLLQQKEKKNKIRSLQKSMLQIRVEEQRQNLRHDHPSCYRCVATGRPPRPQPLSGQRTAAALDMFTTPSAARRAARPASGELTPPDRHLVTPMPHSEPYKWGYADF